MGLLVLSIGGFDDGPSLPGPCNAHHPNCYTEMAKQISQDCSLQAESYTEWSTAESTAVSTHYMKRIISLRSELSEHFLHALRSEYLSHDTPVRHT